LTKNQRQLLKELKNRFQFPLVNLRRNEMAIRILAACGVGMSVSHMMKKVEDAAKNRGLEVEIHPGSIDKLRITNFSGYDLILLGPHVAYQEKAIREKADKTGTKVMVMAKEDYAMFNGENILNKALEILKV
jgi:PTS system cellobiose-specific IIB component